MKSLLKNKKGFGIVEILVAAAVLGFMYMAVLNMHGGNHDALLRIRGRDGAVDVAQQVLDSLKSVGLAAIPSKDDEPTVFNVGPIERLGERRAKWGGGSAKVTYTPQVTVEPTADYTTESTSQFETVQRVYAKQVKVKVSWNFKGTTQSIEVSSVIR